MSRIDTHIVRPFLRRRQRHGVVLYYMTGLMVVMSAFCSFGVDYGRVQLVKAELRRAADSAARAAAAELPDVNSAIAFAKQYGEANLSDGRTATFSPSEDIEFGNWDSKTRTFTRLSGFQMANANCVHITLRRAARRGNAVPLLFARLIGQGSCDTKADAYAMLIPGINVDQFVPGTANPFLAGMPAGTRASAPNPHNNPDFAGSPGDPRQSPLAVNMPLVEGEALTFDSIDGNVRHDPDLPFFGPDGELSVIGHNNLTRSGGGSHSAQMYNENGIADMNAPINSLVGLFLDDRQPNLTAAPANLDFSTAASRNFSTLQPKLKQIFFIGDGKNSNGARQQFIVPKGATRLYLATWDFYEWNNNYGFRNIKVKRPQKIVTVK
jgi:Flp pilus assembly protein TadG